MLIVFTTLFTIVDPFGLAPIFLSLASRFDRKKQVKMIIKSVTVATIVSAFFLFFGKYIFHYLEISFEAVYIVGGILLFLIGLEMIYAKPSKTKTSPEEQEEALCHDELSIFPLAIPMLSGPGTIATLIMFSSRSPGFQNQILILTALILALASAALCMYFSVGLVRILGKTGLNVLGRLLGMILCSMAVQFIINAVQAILGIST